MHASISASLVACQQHSNLYAARSSEFVAINVQLVDAEGVERAPNSHQPSWTTDWHNRLRRSPKLDYAPSPALLEKIPNLEVQYLSAFVEVD
jgi:hypothetical protein